MNTASPDDQSEQDEDLLRRSTNKPKEDTQQHLPTQIQGVPAANLQEQYEDLAAQQLDLRASMDQMHQELKEDMDRRQIELVHLVSALKSSFEGMHLQQQMKDGSSTSTDRVQTTAPCQGILGPNPQYVANNRNHNLVFPRFNGENLKKWLYRIEQYFAIDNTPLNERVRLVAMNLDDEALAWHQAFLKCRGVPGLPEWEEYLAVLVETFGDEFADPMLELKQLKQTGTVREFQFAFDRLVSQCSLSVDQAISCFLGGLKEELVSPIMMHEPKTLSKTYRLARLAEATLAANARSMKQPPGPYQYTNRKPSYELQPAKNPNPQLLTTHKPALLPTNTSSSKTRRVISPAEMQAKRAQGLCYFCNDKYTPGHKCSLPKQMFIMDLKYPEGEMEEDPVKPEEAPLTEEWNVPDGDPPLISLCALSGLKGAQTIHVIGYSNKKSIQILLDGGSTHNFMMLSPQRGWGVTFLQLSWAMSGTTYTSDLIVFPVGKYDLVLGALWMKTLGPITMDYTELTMSFDYQGKHHVLKGVTEECKLSSSKAINRNCSAEAQFFMLQVVSPRTLEECHPHFNALHLPVENSLPEALQRLLGQYQMLFREPTTLPPQRGVFDHRIPLQEGTKRVNIRPYRYSSMKKDIIEKLVLEMLQQSVIQYSNSPFSSPVVLVGKKDGSWRLCVDYRELNQYTVKDKFPIPIIDDLLDELTGATIFSKIDLRSGYHQIRMDHIHHLQQLFEVMQSNSLLAKHSKCVFGVAKVEYLGHFISAAGVATDPKKILAVQQWPVPTTLKQLRGFLGLAGYYRKFIKSYGLISQPLTELLKKDNFKWTPNAELAFIALKKALTTAPVLALPNYSLPFVVETDASGTGIEAVLMQEGHPIAFISKGLAPRHAALSVYEKELLALVFDVSKWSHYLMGQHFIIRTDQKALKYLLEQKIHTDAQIKWIAKLLPFDFEIHYKKGRENVADDSLSRVQGAKLMTLLVSSVSTELWEEITASWSSDPELSSLISFLQQTPQKNFTWINHQLRRKGKLVIGNNAALRTKLLTLWHSTPAGGHSGLDATTRKVLSYFYWKGIRKDIATFILNCTTCQRNKYDTSASPGLLQPLPIPSLP
ncbi:PREDICTED: uncharacterized protein LOC109226006 [Nicotiana attenuata]|uniref:uncharacterized protein LOC109226006 n=1 Tax=Nicotiana attenuata TaxID=49451 RepID=UPI000904D34C|nr:PREDICTED: uncharacterized protein LOC109226006 [Nicotiana attenuata]